MKLFLLFIMLLGFATAPGHESKNVSANEEDCKTMLDSADVLTRTGDISINWQPRIIDEKRQLNISIWLQQRSFSELKCLLESDNKLYQLYGYLYASMFHADSLKGRYASLLSDTTSVQFNSPDGRLIDVPIKLGAVLKSMIESITKDHASWDKKPEIEFKISSFIKAYATYPGTYQSLSFPYFSFVNDDAGQTIFNIRHKYQIQNNKGQVVTITSAFLLDYQLNINVIEPDSTSNVYILFNSPRLSKWVRDYGRKLTHTDSAKLKIL